MQRCSRGGGWAARFGCALAMAAATIAAPARGDIVGTKRSKVYHTHACSFAARIQGDNKVVFDSVAEAEAEGRRLCKVCAGMAARESKRPVSTEEPRPKPEASEGGEQQSGDSEKPAGRRAARSAGTDRAPRPDPPTLETARINDVLVGGTLALHNGDKATLLGVVVPTDGQAWADEAVRFVREQTRGRDARFSYNESPEPVGHFDELGRMRCYIVPGPDGRDLAAELLFQGYAWLDEVVPFDRREEYRRREDQAFETRRGVWRPLDGPEGRRKVVVGKNSRCYHAADCRHVPHLTDPRTLTINTAKSRRLRPCAEYRDPDVKRP